MGRPVVGVVAWNRSLVSLGAGTVAAACGGSTVSDSINGPTTVAGSSPTTIQYGEDPSQFGELWLAKEPAAPVVVLVHGGFWRSMYGLDLMDAMASDLVARDFAVWNIEYRRVGQPGGGHPGTLDDVAAAIDHLVEVAPVYQLDLSRVSAIGHSAGGHLALWSAGRTDARVRPVVTIGLGAVVNLTLAADQRLGNGAVLELLGGTPENVPDRYAMGTPLRAVNGVQMVSVRSNGDDIVPTEFTVPAGDHDYTTVDVAGDHFTLIDPTDQSWPQIVDYLAT